MKWDINSTMNGVLTAAILGIVAFFKRKLNKQKDETEKQKLETCAIKDGVKALLRDRIINTYNQYTKMKHAPIYARENFKSLYDEYHNLGGNGVIDDLYEKFMDLPTSPKSKQ
jgi:hypothetical protein